MPIELGVNTEKSTEAQGELGGEGNTEEISSQVDEENTEEMLPQVEEGPPASETDKGSSCSNCGTLLDQNRQLRNQIKSLQGKLKEKRKVTRKIQNQGEL